ncbi:MAG: class I SAM-dependent RNA methyltransferase [Gemmatimonadaceae bacterium]|nr:class I SAM-dependent RNA methyltransferase [Gemmatimonadaceae bacterium]
MAHARIRRYDGIAKWVPTPRNTSRSALHPAPAQVMTPRTFDAFAIAAPGLAPLLADELRALDVVIGEVSAAGVVFPATIASLLHVNLWSRLATRVIVRVAEFTARDFATLEKQSKRVPWSTLIAPGAAVRFRVTCRKSRLYHSDAVAERVARAVAGAVPSASVLAREIGDEVQDDAVDVDLSARVSSDAESSQLIVVRFEHDRCTISLDSSGDLLHRRGWRQAVAKAPLRETLAAAMLAACDWHGDVPLIDPFCGSGTIGIEGALRARNMAPGLTRRFALEGWPGVSASWVAAQRDAARMLARPTAGVPIRMSDRDAGACAAARANAERAGVAADVEITQCAISAVDLSALGPRGLVLTNPPYGLRVSEGADLRALYARLGDIVRTGGPDWRLGLLVPDRHLAAQTRLQFESLLRTSNGGIGVSVERSKGKPARRQGAARAGGCGVRRGRVGSREPPAPL